MYVHKPKKKEKIIDLKKGITFSIGIKVAITIQCRIEGLSKKVQEVTRCSLK